MPENHIVILCTVPDRVSGETLAKCLVEEHYAACVNLVPGLVSTYRWKGELDHSEEHLLLIKTTADRFEDVKRYIEANHPYELPEIIALPIVAGSAEYLKWITESSK